MRDNKFAIHSLAIGVFATVLVVILGFSTFYQIDEGDRGIILRNGSIAGVAEPGLGFKIPVITSIVTLSVRDQTFMFKKLEAYSYDQQPAALEVSVTYRPLVGEMSKIYSEYGSLENMQNRILERRTLEAVKNVFGKYTATKVIQDREAFAANVREAVRQVMSDIPIQLIGTQIEEIEFSKAYENSIEKRMLAQVHIETTQQEQKTAEIQAQTMVIKAKAEADAKRAQFEAEADGIRVRGKAEADAIEARAKALAQNVNLVQLNAVEKWDGKLPTTQVPGASVPFIGIK